MLIATTSILLITAAVWLLNRVLSFRVCPICAGVSLTWLWMLIGMLSGQLPTPNFQLPTAILMGGSIVGMAYQVEKRLPQDSSGWRTPLLWKTLFIPAGFIAVYSLITSRWLAAASAIAFLMLTAAIFLLYPASRQTEKPENGKKVEELEKKMEECC